MFSKNMEERIPLIRIQAEEGTTRASEGEENEGSEVNPGSSRGLSVATSREDDDDSSNNASNESKSPRQRFLNKLPTCTTNRPDDMRPIIASSSSSSQKSVQDNERPESDSDKRSHKWRHIQAVMAYYQALRKIKSNLKHRTKSNQRWMKLRTTVQLSSAIQKKPPLKREDSFLKRFSTRQIPEAQETVEDTGSEGATGENRASHRQRRRKVRVPRTVVNPDENFYFYWLWVITICVLYNLWTLIVRQSFPELQILCHYFWVTCDAIGDLAFALDLVVQLRTGYLEQGLMVYDSKKLVKHYLSSRSFLLDIGALTPLDLLQLKIGTNPIVRFPRFLKVYRAISCYYMVESRTVYPNFWRVINLIHILLILAHWFGCFYFLLSEAEGFQGDWAYPYRPGDYATLTRKYLGSLYWSTLTLTTIGDLPTPETNSEYVFTIVSYLIGVFIFATIVGQVGNVITNRNANRLEFERLLDGAKTYMRHHKVPGGMKRRVLRWYDYSWSRGRIQGGGDINTALGLLPDKLKTELALHVNLSVLKKVTIFQECQPEFLHDLVLKMKAYIFTPGDSICRKGEVAREMFIIADGILEVLSETGRVLTTMKAGDFFGEIGILNLDGLNKRTADVRSVGYSELFSLSREDVLAAMKDYPEAQDILQTLGRKRLQEARNMSRKFKAEASPDKAAGDDSAPKRIVHKLRTDVKGIRNAIRSRSRAGRRSGESLELRAHEPRLRRMTRVHSDDSQQQEQGSHENGETTSESKDGEKATSPIGAGLPLLSRLKLLKEKQDREEKVANQRLSTSSVITPPPTQPMPSTSSAQDEPEVIGAGLPLIQRLLLLKAKEDKEKNLLTTLSNQPSSSETISPCSLKSPLSPTVKNISPIRKGSDSNSPGKLHSPTSKTSRKNSSGSSDGTSRPKVSFKDRILQVQVHGTPVCPPPNKVALESTNIVAETTQKSDSNLISIPHSVVSKIRSPAKSVGSSLRDKFRLLKVGGSDKDCGTFAIEKIKPQNITAEVSHSKESQEEFKNKKPWNKLKRAAISSESKSKSILDDKIEMETEITEPPAGNLDEGNNVTIAITDTTDLVSEDRADVESSIVSTAIDKAIVVSETSKGVLEKPVGLLQLFPKNLSKTTDSITSSECSQLSKDKRYRSIDDLSPEYGGLPFVKKLKILNERQKLVELENVIKFRSSSLDNTSSSEDLLGDTLTRSHSESSTMDKRKYKRKSLDSVGSHESNETLERRTLKSILKKLSEDVTPAESPERSNELKRLIRAPTIEGYAARHSKFAKSVTFNRHTLPSPPSSASDMPDDVFELPTPIESAPLKEQIKIPEAEQQFTEADIEPEVRSDYNLQQNIDPTYDYKSLRPGDIRVPSPKKKLTIISTVANQRSLWKGSLEEQEYYGELLIGIKQVMQIHLQEIQGKFRESFCSLENEVRKRDEIISQLQQRIQELEKHGLSGKLASSEIEMEEDFQMRTQSKDPSSESDDGIDEGFMRGDSLDTVFTTSPPEVTSEPKAVKKVREEEEYEEHEIADESVSDILEGIELNKLSYSDIQSLGEYLSNKSKASQREFAVSKSKRMDLNLDGKAGTYSRKRAKKLKQRKSWEDQNYRESMELQDLRPLSPQVTSEDRSLLSPEQSSLKRTPLQFFGSHLDSTKSKIKKTLSVDTGMHHTGERKRLRQQRKFSLGSLFGNRGRRQDIELNIASDTSWTESASTSSSDSESIPRTPVFEEFEKANARRARSSSSASSMPLLSKDGGSDWEVMMLVEELAKREQERDDARRQAYALRDLEEESDMGQRDSLDDSNTEDSASRSPTTADSDPALHVQPEPATSRQSRRLILRASSLDSDSKATSSQPRKYGSLKSCRSDYHKRL
ncbi:cyclic-nucleotide-gated cation channel [Danaus plexippus plexippus]|uniref:Cyclic-nucleotide-gated cation channel n=1 Tax=Danaus plexippus plexippus TaxID=278856 RepID=A0A212F241_DANPL|nr:cyclic-nucleotide-gated cation channel [Danaus plexippus plexippus]